MVAFQALLFGFFGVGLVIIAARSIASGRLPFGSNGLRGRLEVTRERTPFGFWLVFAAYAAAGVALVLYALSLALAHAPPLPLR